MRLDVLPKSAAASPAAKAGAEEDRALFVCAAMAAPHDVGICRRLRLKAPAARWAAGLAVFGVLERIGLWLVYGPVSFGDTPTYLRLAGILGDAGVAGYDASRVPGYPLFMLVLEQDPHRIWLAQMALGWGISLALFWIGWRTTQSARFGFVLGMLYNLIPGLVLFEANLLSETLTMFCVVVSLALLVGLGPRSGRFGAVAFLLLGAFAGFAGLVRALFYPLAPWLALFVARLRRRWLLPMALFSIPAALLLGSWVGFVDQQYGMLSPTTMGGYHLVQHTGEFFEYLPDQYADIRDTYLKYREARIAERGAQTNAIWDAIPELSEVTGLSFFGLSAELQRLSVQLILAHPGLYLTNVVKGWIDFWKAPAMWDPAALQLPGLAGGFRTWALAGRAVSLAANALFLGISGLAVGAWLLTKLGGQPEAGRRLLRRAGIDWVFAASAGLIWMISIVQTVVDHGDNPRFLVPLQIVVIYVVLRAGYRWIAAGPG